MGLKPPLYEGPGLNIRNAANTPKKEAHHNPSRNAATIARGSGDMSSDPYICNESTPADSSWKDLPGQTDLGKGSPRPDLTAQGTYGPKDGNPSEKPLSALKYAEIRTTTRGKKSSPPY